MPNSYLLDSNIIIYSTDPAHQFLPTLLQPLALAVSAVSYLEVMGFPKITTDEERQYKILFSAAVIYPVNQLVIEEAVRLRQLKKMSLGDALVAATALVHQLPLISRNKTDFAWISGLQVLNPFDPADVQKIV